MNFGFVHGNTESKKLAWCKRTLKILRSNWKHTCGCSGKTKTVGQKVSGFYQINILDSKLETFLELTDNNFTSTNVFSKPMTTMGFKGGIKAIDIEYFWTKALQLIFSGKKLIIDDVTQWIERPGIVEYFPRVMLNGDVAITQSKQIIRNVLQESGEHWKVEELMQRLEKIRISNTIKCGIVIGIKHRSELSL